MAQEVTSLTIEANTVKSSKGQLSPLGDNDVRIQVLFSAISKNDLLILQGKNKNDFFGPQVIGKVVAVGKNVGHCKLGQTVGVHHGNRNDGDFSSGFASHLQVNQEKVIYIPNSIEPEQAASLIGTGTIAMNALEKVEAGSSIAVAGTGHLAYLVTQFAKKVFNFHTTIFGYQGSEQLAKEFGADAFIALSMDTIKKNSQKFNSVIITDVLKEDEAKHIQDTVWKSGNVILAIDMGFYPIVNTLVLVTSQLCYRGVKRGSYGQAVKALKTASYHNIRGKVEIFEADNFKAAFERAKTTNVSQSIVLKY